MSVHGDQPPADDVVHALPLGPSYLDGVDLKLDLVRQGATAKHLQELYAIAVGVGLFIAMTNLIDDHQQFQGSAFPLVLAYVATLIPFYHGALRHLDDTYIYQGTPPIHDKPWLLLNDFVWLFVEACIFFAMAAYVDAPTAFAFSYSLLLFLDVVWISIYRYYTKSKDEPAKTGWARINILAILVTLATLSLSVLGHWTSLYLAIAVAFIAVARTVLDYGYDFTRYHFYFPLDGDSLQRHNCSQSAIGDATRHS